LTCAESEPHNAISVTTRNWAACLFMRNIVADASLEPRQHPANALREGR